MDASENFFRNVADALMMCRRRWVKTSPKTQHDREVYADLTEMLIAIEDGRVQIVPRRE